MTRQALSDKGRRDDKIQFEPFLIHKNKLVMNFTLLHFRKNISNPSICVKISRNTVGSHEQQTDVENTTNKKRVLDLPSAAFLN